MLITRGSHCHVYWVGRSSSAGNYSQHWVIDCFTAHQHNKNQSGHSGGSLRLGSECHEANRIHELSSRAAVVFLTLGNSCRVKPGITSENYKASCGIDGIEDRLRNSSPVGVQCFGSGNLTIVSEALTSLHWLHVPERLQFKLAVLVHRIMHSNVL